MSQVEWALAVEKYAAHNKKLSLEDKARVEAIQLKEFLNSPKGKIAIQLLKESGRCIPLCDNWQCEEGVGLVEYYLNHKGFERIVRDDASYNTFPSTAEEVLQAFLRNKMPSERESPSALLIHAIEVRLDSIANEAPNS